MGGIELDEDSWNKLVKEVDSNCDGKVTKNLELKDIIGMSFNLIPSSLFLLDFKR